MMERDIAEHLNRLWQQQEPGFEPRFGSGNLLHAMGAIVQPNTMSLEIHFRQAHQSRASKVWLLEEACYELEGFRAYYDKAIASWAPGYEYTPAPLPGKLVRQPRSASPAPASAPPPRSTAWVPPASMFLPPPKFPPAGNPLYGSW